MAPAGPAGDELRAAAAAARAVVLAVPTARIRRGRAWAAEPECYEDDLDDPNCYAKRPVYQQLAEPDDRREVEELLDRLRGTVDRLWWAASRQPVPAKLHPEVKSGLGLKSKRSRHRAADGGLVPAALKLLDAIAAVSGGVTGEEAAVSARTSHEYARKLLPGLIEDDLVTHDNRGYRITPAGRKAV